MTGEHVHMGLIDLILNLVGLLVWLNWRSLRFDPLSRTTPATLVGTLKPAEARRRTGWQLLAGLVLLLLLRALLYRGIGPPVRWTPKLDLGFIAPAFRSDILRTALLYSLLSFVRVLVIFYFWLLALAAINRSIAEPDPIQKLLRLHLGRIARWPWPLQLLLPVTVTAALWLALNPPLVYLDLLSRSRSNMHLVEQGFLIGLSLFFTLKYLLPVFLFLYLILSYVYLGGSPFWDFITVTARNLLAPLRLLPLRFAKIDFAPVLGIILIFLLLDWLPKFVLAKLAQNQLAVWPQ